MDVVVFNCQCEDEAAKHKGYDIIHIGLGDFVGLGEAEEGVEKEWGHGGDCHGNCIGEPPKKDPGENSQHVAAGLPASAEVDEEEDEEA